MKTIILAALALTVANAYTPELTVQKEALSKPDESITGPGWKNKAIRQQKDYEHPTSSINQRDPVASPQMSFGGMQQPAGYPQFSQQQPFQMQGGSSAQQAMLQAAMTRMQQPQASPAGYPQQYQQQMQMQQPFGGQMQGGGASQQAMIQAAMARMQQPQAAYPGHQQAVAGFNPQQYQQQQFGQSMGMPNRFMGSSPYGRRKRSLFASILGTSVTAKN